MTPKQKAVLDAVRDLTVDGVGPSMREVAMRTGMGLQGVTNCVDALLASNHLYRTPTARRNLRAVGKFDVRALAAMSHHDLLVLRDAVDARLNHRRAA